MSKSQKTIEQKVQEEFPDFAIECQRLNVDGLNTKLIQYAKYAEEIEDFRQKDEKLAQAKELVKELAAPHNENRKFNRMKMRYIVSMIREKGGG